MASKRMFNVELLKEEIFSTMSGGALGLYLILGTNADDEGFVNNPNIYIRMYDGLSKESLDELVNNGLVIKFDSGVVLIKHWFVSNYDSKDNKNKANCTRTKYLDEADLVELDNKKHYVLKEKTATPSTDNSLSVNVQAHEQNTSISIPASTEVVNNYHQITQNNNTQQDAMTRNVVEPVVENVTQVNTEVTPQVTTPTQTQAPTPVTSNRAPLPEGVTNSVVGGVTQEPTSYNPAFNKYANTFQEVTESDSLAPQPMFGTVPQPMFNDVPQPQETFPSSQERYAELQDKVASHVELQAQALQVPAITEKPRVPVQNETYRSGETDAINKARNWDKDLAKIRANNGGNN